MYKTLVLVLIGLCASCHPGNLKILGDLPKELKEVSGIETVSQSHLIWMHNDGGNKSRLYGVDRDGKIIKTLKIDAKNNDWEDLTSDADGNIYIGDFGNNENKRKNLAILKVKAKDLDKDKKVDIKRIAFYYEKQSKFPPKKKKMYFDCESFIYHKGHLYLFTKSRVKGNHGRTDLYKIPAIKGEHKAQYMASFNTCEDLDCWVTSVDISDDGKKLVMLTPKAVWVFSNFTSDNFFNGAVTTYNFDYISQKEGVCFKDQNTLYITDENAHGSDGNLYEFRLD